MAALDALGPVRVVVVPNRMHRYDAPRWRARYPEARFLCPAAAREAVEQVVPVDGTCEGELPALGVEVHALDGWKPGELAYELTVDGGRALVFCDCLFHLPHQPGWIGASLRWIGSTGFFGTTGIGRWFFMADRARWRGWLETQAKRTDLVALCVAHGAPVLDDCAGALAAAAHRL